MSQSIFTLTTLFVLVISICAGVAGLGLTKLFSPEYTKLRQYNVDPNFVSVSGLSNGAAFAVQMSFIYSSLITGVGVFAGSPYPVAHLVYNSQLTRIFSINDYYPHIDRWSAEGLIDPVSNLNRTRAFVFQGFKDAIVPWFFNWDIAREYQHYGSALHTSLQKIRGGHCVPTDNFPAYNYLLFVGSMQGVCNAGYQGINHMFYHFLGPEFVLPPNNTGTPTGHLFKFDQNEFFPNQVAEAAGLKNAAWTYVPRLCEDGNVKCKLHLAFHGSGQPIMARIMADGFSEYVNNAGYLQAADANNIIVIFPEAASINIAGWDIWGFSGKDFLFKNGLQPKAISRMIRRVLHGE